MPFSLRDLFILVAVFGYLVAFAFFPTLAWTRARRRPFVVLAIALVALSPLVLPATAPFARVLAAILGIVLMVKFYDLHRSCSPTLHPTFGGYLAYLPNVLCLVWRRLPAAPRPSRAENLRPLGLALAQAAPGVALFVWLVRRDWLGIPFLLEHGVKVTAFFLAFVPVSHAWTAFWRLCGGRAYEPMDRPILAVTPADFWRRYNRPTQQFFHDHIYRRNRRHPLRAVALTFVISALVHEYIFIVALLRVQGLQTAFFLLHGLAVALTIRYRPKGRVVPFAIAATFLFTLTSSVLFFASFQATIPLYENALPAWLAR